MSGTTSSDLLIWELKLKQGTSGEKDVTNASCCGFTAVQPVRLRNIRQEPPEMRTLGCFRFLLSFHNVENVQTGEQQGCHILHFISRLLNKYTYNKANIRTIMDLHVTGFFLDSEETCSLWHSVFKT